MPLSVIIPTLNEEARIGNTIAAARAAGADEIVVADGGSSDATVIVAAARGARVITGERMRARQLNRGAEAASHEALLFLHADTLLPRGAGAAVMRALDEGFDCGAFLVQFIEGGPRLAYVAFMINMRTRLTGAPWGDQAHFFRRSAFPGYPEIPIMEDYALARRMKRVAILPLRVRTSGRRFLAKGVIRTSIVNWAVIAGYHLGVSPERLAKWYRR